MRRGRTAKPGAGPKRHWRRIAAIAVITLLGATAIGALSIRQATQRTAPQIALSISANYPPAANALARVLLGGFGAQAPMDRVMSLSRRSITAQGINPDALRNAGLALSLAGQEDAALPLLNLAQRMSKRDPMINLLLFNHAIQEGRIPQAMVLLDRALRVDPGVQQSIYPRLAQALADPEVMREVAPFIAERPDWAFDFAAFAVNDPVGGPALAEMVQSYPATAAVLSPDRQRSLVRRLAERGEFETARRIFAFLSKRQPTHTSDELGFDQHGDWPIFDWELGATGQLSVFKPRGEGIEFTVRGGGAHRIARRIIELKPGTYRMVARARAIDGALSELGLRATISCVGGNSPRVATLAWLSDSETDASDSFAVPSACEQQWLEVRARGQREPRTGALSNIAIEPVR